VSVRERAPSGMVIHELVRVEHSGLVTERMMEIQRSRILGAMMEACAEHGAGNVTVAHVVEHAGVSRRTFYELFEDREECFLAALDQALVCAHGYVSAAYEPDASWNERVRASLTALLQFLEDEPYAGRLLFIDTLAAGDRALERRRHVLAQLIAIVDKGRREVSGDKGPSPLTAEGLVGGALAIIHSRMIDGEDGSILDLAGSLMGMIVLPYLGPAAARRELKRSVHTHARPNKPGQADPLRDVGMRLTYRTVRVLLAIGESPGSSNRQIGSAAGAEDQGQISKLLTRLTRVGLIENCGTGPARGGPNAWMLTEKGWRVRGAIAR
jgi:AcrR family transcriptional regulator